MYDLYIHSSVYESKIVDAGFIQFVMRLLCYIDRRDDADVCVLCVHCRCFKFELCRN